MKTVVPILKLGNMAWECVAGSLADTGHVRVTLVSRKRPEEESIERFSLGGPREADGARNSAPSRAVLSGLGHLGLLPQGILLVLLQELSGAPRFLSVSRNGCGAFQGKGRSAGEKPTLHGAHDLTRDGKGRLVYYCRIAEDGVVTPKPGRTSESPGTTSHSAFPGPIPQSSRS